MRQLYKSNIMSSRVIAKSVRYSCANDQNPFPVRIGNLVVIKATIMITSNGTAAKRIIIPMRISKAQIISNDPVKYAQN